MKPLPLLLLLSLAGNIAVPSVQSIVYQQLRQLPDRILYACGFLRTLYNPALGLVRETNNTQTYHIASDNLLAQKALESCDPQMAASIRTASSTCCGNGQSLMHEALLDIEISLPTRTANIFTIANSSRGELFNGVSASAAGGDYTVFWEVHNGTGTLSNREYADVAAYVALEYLLSRNQTGTSEMVENLNIMFDGQGMVDEPHQNGPPGELGIYQTYKLALYIHLQARQYGAYPGLVERLLRMQGTGGGFHTGYDQQGTYAGTRMNAETTSIVIIVLDQLATMQPPQFGYPFVSLPSLGEVLLYIAIVVAAGTAAGLGVIYWERRRKRRSSQTSNLASLLAMI